MEFSYKAKKGLGEVENGTIIAENQQEALSKLTEKGLFPVSIEAVGPRISNQKTALVGKKKFFLSKRITSRQIVVFTQKLTTLVRAKVELLHALKIIHEQTEDPAFQGIILEIYNFTKEGKVFSESLTYFPKIFSNFYINVIKAGETSGELDAALEQISDFITKQEALKQKVLLALAYPGLLLFVGIVSIFILMNFVIPQLRPIFDNSNVELPLITKIILNISSLSNSSRLIGLMGVVMSAVFLYYKRESLLMKRIIRVFKTKVPIISRIIKNQDLTNFSHSLFLLVKSKVPALKALEVVVPGLEDDVLKGELVEVCQQVASGQRLSTSMEALTSLPNFFTKMLAVGEESGRLTEVLEEITLSYSNQVDSDVALVSSLVEPVLILFLGVIMGTIVLAILIPTFQMSQIAN
ncbi:MAG: type II secretion system F family protein [Candidatus Omnitrophica bacterium]|nr:type II secretion system F family protein [Candidatus Omnitrophota bacterium]